MAAEQWLLIVGTAAFTAYLISQCIHLKKMAPVLAALGCAAAMAALSFIFLATGRAPWASLPESATLLALIVGLSLLAATLKNEPGPLRLGLATMAALLLAFSAYSAGSPGELPPALESGWLLVHVPVAMAAYGLFACAATASLAYLYYRWKSPSEKAVSDRLDRLATIFTIVGEALLAIAIVLGALWAQAAWGSYWSWDPKEIWALITAVLYGFYLLLRRLGMKGEEAAYVSLVGFICVLFTYLGVSYVIPGLHSYA